VSQNGYIKFDTAQAGQYSPYTITQGIPGNMNVKNSIMAHYSDIYPGAFAATTNIYSATLGVAPNRKFIVGFCNAPMYSCTALQTSFQIILYETTNVIEIHLTSKPLCTSWNNGAGIEGIQNANGTIAHVVPGRNYPGTWTANNSSHSFTPTSATAYTISPIAFSPVPVSGGTIQWFLANGTTPVGTGNTFNFVAPAASTYYVARSVYCQDTARDTFFLTIGAGFNIDSVTFTNPTTCGGLGSITLHGLEPNEQYLITLNRNGTPMTPINIITGPNGAGTFQVYSGNYSNITSNQGLCFSNTVGPVVILDPPITAGYNYTIKYGCDQDTVVFQNFSATAGGLTQVWDFGDGTQDTSRNPTKIYPNQGIYTVKLRVTNGVCADSTQQSIDVLHPLVASFTQSADSFCQGGTVAFTNTSVTTTRLGIAPKYFWTFGDGGTDTVENPTHTYTRAGVWPVTLTVRDFVPCVDTATSIVVIDSIPFVSLIASDSVLCEGQAVTFKGDFLQLNNTGYVWNFGDGSTEVRNRNPVTHGFEGAGTYTVTLTAEYRICADTAFTREVEIRPFTSINIGPDTSICPGGEPLMLSARLSDGSLAPNSAIVRWSTGDTSASILVRHQGDYWAVADLAGCTSADSMHVAKDCYLDLPNVFSPNSDGTNDYFWPRQLLSEGITAFHMTIFNRWGQKIWETSRIDGRGWDGKFNGVDQPTGVYIYFVEAELKNGFREKYQGNVTLLR
jgi:gliding motility-associated-like protein